MAGGAGASGGGAANPWLINESEDTKGLTFGEIKQQQQRIIEGNHTGLNYSPIFKKLNKLKHTAYLSGGRLCCVIK